MQIENLQQLLVMLLNKETQGLSEDFYENYIKILMQLLQKILKMQPINIS